MKKFLLIIICILVAVSGFSFTNAKWTKKISMTPPTPNTGVNIKFEAEFTVYRGDMNNIEILMEIVGKKKIVRKIGTIKKLQSRKVAFNWIAQPGTHTVRFTIDPKMIANDLNINDNITERQFTISTNNNGLPIVLPHINKPQNDIHQIQQPQLRARIGSVLDFNIDLTVSKITFLPSTPAQGGEFTAFVDIKNTGAEIRKQFYVSLNIGSLYSKTEPVAFMPANNEKRITFKVDKYLKAGSYKAMSMVDSSRVITEKDENNNTKDHSFTVESGDKYLALTDWLITKSGKTLTSFKPDDKDMQLSFLVENKSDKNIKGVIASYSVHNLTSGYRTWKLSVLLNYKYDIPPRKKIQIHYKGLTTKDFLVTDPAGSSVNINSQNVRFILRTDGGTEFKGPEKTLKLNIPDYTFSLRHVFYALNVYHKGVEWVSVGYNVINKGSEPAPGKSVIVRAWWEKYEKPLFGTPKYVIKEEWITYKTPVKSEFDMIRKLTGPSPAKTIKFCMELKTSGFTDGNLHNNKFCIDVDWNKPPGGGTYKNIPASAMTWSKP